MAGFFFTNSADDPLPSSPDAVAQKRKLAQALMQQGMDFSPVRSPWQGAARVAQGVLGALDYRDADKQDAAGYAQAQKQISDLMGGFGGSPAATPAAPAASPSSAVTAPEDLAPLIQKASVATGVPMDLLTAQIKQESGFNPNAVGKAGEIGLMQILPSTAKDPGFGMQGVDPAALRDPATNIMFGANYLKARAGGNLNGPQAVAAALKSYNGGGDPNYVSNVTRYMPGGAAKVAAAAPAADDGEDTETPDAAAPKAAVASALTSPTAPANPFAAKLPGAMAVLNNPYATAGQKMIAQAILQKGMTNPEQYNTFKDADGNLFQKNSATGQMQLVMKASDNQKDPEAVRKLNAAGLDADAIKKAFNDPNDPNHDVVTKALGGGGQTINIGDKNANDYTTQLTEGLAKSHASLANGVEANAEQLRGVRAMQGALARIQANGGTTGIGQEELSKLKGAVNSGATALGIDQPYDISDPEFMTKFNRQIAGAQAKAIGGSRVTNFELQNFLAANPGLALSPTGNQRLLGIQEQVAQRNLDLGQTIRQTTANALANKKQINPADIEGLIRQYDMDHPIVDPVTKQDLTKKLELGDLQTAPVTQPAPGSSKKSFKKLWE